MKPRFPTAFLLAALVACPLARAQDTTTVQQAIYDRPYIAVMGRAAVGGYAEANVGYVVEDGISEGVSAEMRRFNVFLFAPLGSRLRFTSELEFEHGTEEIALETALLDVTLHPAVVLRGGVLLPPVGAFNQNHDSPRWDFVDRPLVSTEVLPATLSEVGFGVYGRGYRGRAGLSYDLYLTNGLGDGVVSNEVGRTCVPCGKDEGAFGEDNNGSPAFSGRLAALHRDVGEAGVSFYTALYNTFARDGMDVDTRRRLTLLALDGQAHFGRLALRGEAALAFVDVPGDLADLYAERQWAAHLDGVVLLWTPRPFGRPAPLSAVLRLEAVDFNAGTFDTTGQRIYDETVAAVGGLSFRPVPETVVLLNYRRQGYRDLAGNPAVQMGSVRFGFATYF
ncbi:MAG TPA: hypothetical protein VD962_06300 [Rubricoccaceae bacterium]|nr:hypothetical protein [Rubricoccaceae bacterium]